MKSLSSKTYQCGVTIQGLTTLSGTVYLTGITNTASWDHVIVGTTAQGQIYTRTYAQFMGDVATGISLSSYVTGSGTTNYLPKFTGASALGNSQIFDNGTNVGIGTASPSAKLHLSGSGVTELRITSTTGNTNSLLSFYESTLASWGIDAGQANGSFFIKDLYNSATRLTINYLGNVGIGTTSPSHNLHIYGANDRLIKIENTGTYLMYVGLLSNEGYIGSTNATPLGFYTNNVNRIYINTSGNVGIGTTAPARKLDVNGTSVFRDFTSVFAGSGNIVSNITWLSTDSGIMNIYTGGSPTVQLNSNGVSYFNGGNVGIGTASPGHPLEIYGGSMDPSLAAAGSSLLSINSLGVELAIGRMVTSPHSIWLQGKHATINDLTYALVLNPLGGNIGIGTDSPSYKFTLNESTTNPIAYFGTAPINASSRNALIILQSGTIPQSGSDTTGEVGFLFKHSYGTGGVNGTANGGYIESIRESVFGITSQVNTALIFGTSAANTDGERMRITSSGNVGIGTNSPSYKLQVNADGAGLYVLGANTAPYTQTIASFVYGGNGNSINIENQGGKASIQARDSSNNAMNLHLNPVGGNVGIGTTSPNYKLDVNGSFNALTSGVSLTYNSGILYHGNYYQFTSGNNYLLYARGGGDLLLGSNDTERMRITSGGNILMNTVTATTTGGFTNTTLSVKQVADGLYGGGLHIEENATTSVAYFGFNGIAFNIGTSYRTTGDYRPIAFSTNGAERLRIANDGNVGIGTTSPTEKLHIIGNIKVEQTTNTNAVLTLNPYSTGLGTSYQWNLVGGNSGQNYAFQIREVSSTYLHINNSAGGSGGNVGIGTTSPSELLEVVGNIRANISNGGGFMLTGASASGLVRAGATGLALRTNTTDRLTVDNSGNVGIGTTSPGAKLHVVGDTYIQGTEYIFQSVNSTVGYLYFDHSGTQVWKQGIFNDNTSTFSIGNGGGFTRLFNITNAGNVGIGRTNPSTWLELNSTAVGNYFSEGLKINRGEGFTTQYGILNSYAATGFNLIAVLEGGGSGGTINFMRHNAGSGTPTSSMFITGAGDVGIGTTNPGAKLEVYSSGTAFANIKAGGGDYAYLQLTTPSSGNGYLIKNTATGNSALNKSLYLWNSDGPIQFIPSDTVGNAVTINTSGNVGIGTTSPAYKLHTYGTNPRVFIQDASTGYPILQLSNNSTGNFFISIDNSAGTGFGSAYGRYLYSEGVYPMVFATNSAEAMRITSAGNVGIGTASPSALLDVNGRVIVGGGLNGNAFSIATSIGTYTFNDYDLQTPSSFLITAGSSGYLSLDGYPIIFKVSGSERMRVHTSGNIGIGTSSPSQLVEAYQSFNGDVVYQISNPNAGTSATAQFFASNGTTRTQFFHTGTSYNGTGILASSAGLGGIYNNTAQGIALLASSAAGVIKFGTTTSNTERMRIASDGNVGIGTITPSTLLDVSGVITATGGNSTNWNTAYGWGNHASASYVPQARTLTINGTSYDLSANRTWTIATSGNIQQAADNGKVTTAASVGTTVITTVATATYDGATFNYVLKDGTNYRAGTIIAVWSAGAVQFNETTTNDIGSTVGVTFAVALNAGNAELRATSATSGWTVKVVTIGI